MATTDNKESFLQSELSNIFAEVQENLPSLDFDGSDVSSDEELSIFNRSLKTPVEATGHDDALSPTSWQSALITDDSQREQEEENSLLQIQDVDIQVEMKDVGPNELQGDGDKYEDVGLSDMEFSFSGTHKKKEDNKFDKSPMIEREKNKFSNNNIIYGQKEIMVPSEDNRIVSKFISNMAPVPDFQRVQEQNLDHLLTMIPVDSSRDSPSHIGAEDENLEAEKTSSLMDKLAKLCMTQAGHSKRTASSKYRLDETKQTDLEEHNIGGKSTGLIGTNQRQFQSTGTSMCVATDVSTETMPVTTCSKGVSAFTSFNNSNSKNRETIYLDLREKDETHQKAKTDEVAGLGVIQRILGFEPAEDESDDNDDDVIDWQKQRKQIRDALSEGQSMKSHNDLPTPRKVIRISKVAPPPRVMHLPPKEESSTYPEKLTKLESKNLEPRETDISHSQLQKVAPEIHLTDKVKKRQEADLKKLRKRREEEKATKLRLQKQLEGLKPTHSIGGKNKSRSVTDILFDVEASYTQVPRCLPPVSCYTGETLLLSMCLTSCLQLKAKSSAGGRIIDSHCCGISATYITLLSWLLSCVPCNFDFLMVPLEVVSHDETSPFYVVGLQQILLDGELMLIVAIRPTGKVPPMATKHKRKKKESKRSCSTFESLVIEFLNKNTLHSVCPNAENAFSLIVSSSGAPCLLSNQSQDRLLPDGTYIPDPPFVCNKPLSTFISIKNNVDAIDRVFSAPVGFFWQTLESEYPSSDTTSSESYDNENNIQNTMSLIYKSIYQDQICMLSILNRIIHEGLDISGLRLIYSPKDMSLEVPAASYGRRQAGDSPRTGSDEVVIDDLNNIGPILVFALRGANARNKWVNIVGPSDPQIARRTDPNSLIALFGGDRRSEVAIYCPRNESRVHYELTLWFGGRVPLNGVVDVGSNTSKLQKLKSHNNKKKQAKYISADDNADGITMDDDTAILSSVPPALLTASSSSDIFLLVSPIIPPMCIGTILSTCCERGFQLRGLRRLRLNAKRTSVLGMTGIQSRVFSPISCTTPTSPQNHDQLLREQIEHGFSTAPPSPMPSLVILLRRENAYSQGYSLIESLMVKLALQGLLLNIQMNMNTKLISSSCFHVVPYSESQLANLGGDICRVADTERHISLLNQGWFYTNPELEQVVVVTLVGNEAMKAIGGYLDKILCFSNTGMELLGIKWLPSLTWSQAREITPFEVGDRHWHSSLQSLTANPAVISIMRGVDAFQRLRSILGNTHGHSHQTPSLEKLISPTAELAYRQTVTFFSDRELFSDPSVRLNLKYQPPLRNPNLEAISTARFMWTDDPQLPTSGKSRVRGGRSGKKSFVVEESVFKSMTAGPRPITTVAVIKPDTVKHNLVKILKYMTREGFRVVGLRFLKLSREQTEALIPVNYKKVERFIERHNEVLTSGQSMALCLQRENAVKKLLDLCGPDDPKHCRNNNQFLWRGIFGQDIINNGLHVSQSYSAAVQEEKLLFPAGLCCQPTPDLVADDIICPSLDPIIGIKGRKFVIKETDVKDDQRQNSVFLSAHSGLCETTCVVLTPPLILQNNQKNQGIYIDILEKLVAAGFQVVGARLMTLTEKQSLKVVHLFKCSVDKLVPILSDGPTLVLALQRDNAVTCWETILKGCLVSSEILSKYAKDILRPVTLPQAHNALGFFFDNLCNSCQGKIIHDEKGCSG